MDRACFSLLAACALTLGACNREHPAAVPSEPKAALQSSSVAGVYNEQLGYWTRKLEQDPKSYLPRKRIADTNMRLAQVSGRIGLYREALTALSDASPYGPNGSLDIEYIELATHAHMALHDFHEALQLANQCIGQGYDDHRLDMLKGEAELALGLYEEAQSSFEKVARKNPDVQIALHLATMREIFGRPDDAMKTLNKARDGYHGFEARQTAIIRHRIGLNHFHAGRLDPAAGAFAEALEALPEFTASREKLAEILAIDGRFEEARNELRSALKLRAEPSVLLTLAKIERAAGNEKLAASLHGEAVRIYEASMADGNVVHLRDLALALLEDPKQKQRALELAKADLMTRPDEIMSNLVAAKAYRLNGRFEEAGKHLEKSMRYETKRAEIYIEAHFLYKELNEPEKAREFFEKAVWISPAAVKSAGLQLGY